MRDELKEGEQLMVKVINIDPTGKIRLSRKALLEEAEPGAAAQAPAHAGHAPSHEGHGPSHEGHAAAGRRPERAEHGDRPRGPRRRH